MSLNRCEQSVFDYVEKHPEERQFWMHKVRDKVQNASTIHEAAAVLDSELWYYLQERARVVPVLQEYAGSAGGRRISMKNLAEYLIRLWAPPKPKKPAPPPPESLF